MARLQFGSEFDELCQNGSGTVVLVSKWNLFSWCKTKFQTSRKGSCCDKKHDCVCHCLRFYLYWIHSWIVSNYIIFTRWHLWILIERCLQGDFVCSQYWYLQGPYGHSINCTSCLNVAWEIQKNTLKFLSGWDGSCLEVTCCRWECLDLYQFRTFSSPGLSQLGEDTV